ncbi:MAG: hypothetical protein C0397_17125 [Odoribacter sp.]|nr:hypothetical protein [Odoribacter sp.]
MISIKVSYRPFPFLWKRNCKAEVPQNWSEINAMQLKSIVKLYDDKVSEISFLATLTGLKRHILKNMTNYERFKLMEILEFIGSLKPYHQFIIRKIYTSITGPTLFSPEGKLKGVSFGQFIFSDTYFANYQESQNPDDLNKFIVSLYLRKNEKFDEKLINERYQKLSSLDENTRQAILLNYQLMHEWLTEAYPLIFQKVQQQVESNEDKKPRNSNNWVKVFQNFVGDDIVHDHLWAEKPVNTILSYMTRKYKENARRK